MPAQQGVGSKSVSMVVVVLVDAEVPGVDPWVGLVVDDGVVEVVVDTTP
jgi:hypothetical protein